VKISLNWLKAYLNINHSPEKIGEILTDIGLEVEGIKQIESIKGGLEGIKIGQVLTCEKHPNADKLKITTVNVGAESELQIVCGAPNVAAGQKVIVATIGTTLYPVEGDSFKIKKGKIRGEVSEGMICAEDEIGLGSDHDGIIVLEEDAIVGKDAKDHYKISTDFIYDIGLTPNRSDATSHIGVAQDLLAYFKTNEGFTGQVDLPDVVNFHSETKTLPFQVEIKDIKGCPRYSGVTISNVTIKQSPQWMKDRLNSIGVRPISNIVDITNFILHELGQPLHAFDADKIPARKIVIQTLPEGSKFTALDEKERTLSESDLIVCDDQSNGLCIAGVFGGISSGVTEQTKNIFLESAHFNASYIRTTSTKHLLRTDAAMIFEKGSDPNLTVYALKRAALLIKELGGGTISSEIIDKYPKEIKKKEIELHYASINEVIGTEISPDIVHTILSSMNMEIKPVDKESIAVKVPTNKADVLREIDLIEEILRIYGYNNVPISTTINSTINYQGHPSKNTIKRSIASFLSSHGFNEMMGLSLMEEKQIIPELSIDKSKLIFINNTSNIHLNILRPEPIVNGLVNVIHNHNYQQKDLKLFEMGRTYQIHKENNDEFVEDSFLSLFISGAHHEENWIQGGENKSNFYTIKKYTTFILSHLGIKSYQTDELKDERWAYGLNLFRGNKQIVRFGELSQAVLKELDIKQDVFCAEFDLDNLCLFASKQKLSVKPISKFPAVRRDLALVLDEEVEFSMVLAAAHKVKSKILQEVCLFDVYKNEEHLGAGKKSYAIKFIFQDQNDTLKDKAIDKEMNKLIKSFEDQNGAIIRS